MNGVIFQNAAGLADHLEVCSVSAIFPRVPEKVDFPSGTAGLYVLDRYVQNLLEGFPKTPNLERLRASFELAVDPRRISHREEEEWIWNSWDDNWTRVVRPLVLPNVRVAG
jgi:hypothetical protein